MPPERPLSELPTAAAPDVLEALRRYAVETCG
jgi:hypothetical protein